MIEVDGFKLKRCPFCGNGDAPDFATAAELEECKVQEIDLDTCPEFNYYAHGLYGGNECHLKSIICNVLKGGCGARTRFYENPEQAVNAWNTRAVVATYDECEEYE